MPVVSHRLKVINQGMYTYVGSDHFLGFRNLAFFFWFSEKYFVDIFLGHHKTGLVFGSFLCILGTFLKVNVQNRDIYFGC